MNLKKKCLHLFGYSVLTVIFFSAGCKTVDLEEKHKNEFITEDEGQNVADYSFSAYMDIEEDDDEISDEELYVNEIMKENDVASAVIYIEPPEVIECEPSKETPDLTGEAALKQNLKDITVLPQYTEGRLKGWTYKEGQIYQIHTQTYHSTLIQFEPGEEMLEVPYISEPDVWRLARGIGIKNGKDTQFLIIKPDYSGLTSTLIVITNFRVYQMELKSYKDHYMPYVKWIYPQPIQDNQSWLQWQQRKQNKAVLEFTGTDMSNCSFDYTVTHGLNKPLWCPEMVYDDGKFTYIVLPKKILHMEMPAVFIGSRRIINTQVHKNVIVINQLITKATLRLGNQKVKIKKKKAPKSELEITQSNIQPQIQMPQIPEHPEQTASESTETQIENSQESSSE